MGLLHHIRHIRADPRRVSQAQVAQEFDVTLRPFYGGEGQPQDCKAKAVRQVYKSLQHLHMGTLLPNDPLLANLVPAGLKLGLDEAQNLTGGLQQRLDRRKHNFQGDEADIHHG